MPDTTTEHLTAGQLADQATHAIHELNHRTHPTGDDLAYPADTAAIIATLASMTGMLPQLLAQLTHWLAHQHQDGRLNLDSLAPLPDLASTMHALTSSLQHAIGHAQHTAEKLDTAHQHAAHLAAAEPATNDQGPNTAARGQNSCRSVGPNHLTKRRRLMRAFEDLPPDWQQRIRALAVQAPPLSTRQRERVEQLLRGADPPEGPDQPTGGGE